MKEIVISVHPKWCELIANRTKTVEIRKTKPKLNTPFRCYIYCTKSELLTKSHYTNKIYVAVDKDHQKALERCGNITLSDKVIGEFVCDRIDTIRKRGIDNNFDYCYLPLDVFGNDDIEVEISDIKKSCIKKDELNFYGSKSSELYAWHISNLVIYDEPKELSKFCKPFIKEITTGLHNRGNKNSGDYNKGNRNSGNRNSGSFNSGNKNSGDYNSGSWNSGDWNSGNGNSGDNNSGDCNSGDWNKGKFSNGCFNTELPKIFLFNKPSDWTYQDWLDSNVRFILMDCPSNITEWVRDNDMTDKEKEQYPEYSVIGGFLKNTKREGERQEWWDNLTKEKKIL